MPCSLSGLNGRSATLCSPVGVPFGAGAAFAVPSVDVNNTPAAAPPRNSRREVMAHPNLIWVIALVACQRPNDAPAQNAPKQPPTIVAPTPLPDPLPGKRRDM